MARPVKPELTEKDIQGLKYLKPFQELLEPLLDIPCHGNRLYTMHNHVNLLLLSFFSPTIKSLRALQQAIGLKKVQEAFGVKPVSLGAMSESASMVFDPRLLEPLIAELSRKAQLLPTNPKLDTLPWELTATDGSFLRCLPKMAWALFRTQSPKRGVKMHLQFDILRQAPTQVSVTKAMGSEKKELRKFLQPNKLYVTDRGYVDYSLFQKIHEAQSFFVARIKDNSSFQVNQDCPLTPEAQAAGVLRDQKIILGSAYTEGALTAPVRRLEIQDPDRPESSILLLTNTELDGEIIGLLYRYRWQVELFFRWFKCILKCTHWFNLTPSAVTLQIYVAIIASLLIRLWTGRQPTRRTFEMICLYFQGWASAEELAAHIEKLKKVD